MLKVYVMQNTHKKVEWQLLKNGVFATFFYSDPLWDGKKKLLDNEILIHHRENRLRQEDYEEIDNGCSAPIFQTPVDGVRDQVRK